MKKLTMCTLAAVALLGLTGTAQAQNAAEGVGDLIACGAGECFVPRFTFLGQVQKYSGTGIAGGVLKVDGADCCLSGDKYKVTSKTGGLLGSFTTTHIAASSCTTAWTSPSSVSTQAGSSGKVLMKILLAGGGFPAGAYVRMSHGSWVQTAGSDSCGF